MSEPMPAKLIKPIAVPTTLPATTTQILPLREIISEQTLLNYNGMLSDLFGLLADARSRVSANVKAIEAKRDFWLASVDLQAAIYGGGMSGAGGAAAAMLATGNPD